MVGASGGDERDGIRPGLRLLAPKLRGTSTWRTRLFRLFLVMRSKTSRGWFRFQVLAGLLAALSIQAGDGSKVQIGRAHV